VIDVLRATSTATQALAAGYRRVLCAESVERARAMRAPGRVLAGERLGIAPDGFDQGNSPAEVVAPRGRELILTTTNGAGAIVAACDHAPRVLLACLLNLAAVTAAIGGPPGDPDVDVQIICSGTDGTASLEDIYVAGRICTGLAGERTDAALAAQAVARGFPTALEALGASADAHALRELGLGDDIAWCARESVLSEVGIVIGREAGVAIVAVDPPTVAGALG
jgi:2-phosphosulfolactate phosphatase